jgi:hypothetical protein
MYELDRDIVGTIIMSWTYCDGTSGSVTDFTGENHQGEPWNTLCIRDGSIIITAGDAIQLDMRV